MTIIVAVDENWAIGNRGGLLLRVPADMKRFREMTTGKVVVLGRKTLQTFPQGAPLKDRVNYILSTNPDYGVKGARVVHDIPALLEALEQYDAKDVFVIGGGTVYEALLPYCDVCEVTRFERAFAADTWFPDLDASPEWRLEEESEEQVYFDTPYTFRRYVRQTKK